MSVVTPWSLAVLFLLFFIFRKQKTALLQGSILVIAVASYTYWIKPPKLKEEVKGRGYFSIGAVKACASPFQKGTVFQGTFRNFVTDEGISLGQIPVSIKPPKKGKRPTADTDYIVSGILNEESGRYFFKATSWEKQKKTWSLAEWRYRCKQTLFRYFKQIFVHKSSAEFLATLVTGDVEERFLRLSFNRLGLQHLLAISGFHFGLIAFFSGIFLRLVLPKKIATATLLILLSAYFFFIGQSPSIQRAFIGISLYLIGDLCNLRTSGLNALGAALIIAIILDPLSCQTLGFQLSFLVTAGILLLYPIAERYIRNLLPKRPLDAVAQMTFIDKHGYILSAMVRKALALTLAVNAVALPVSLYLFHQFPVLSIAYNLFFPLLVSLSLFLLFLAIPFTLIIPPLATVIHICNSHYTAAILALSERPPVALNYSLYAPCFPLPLLLVILSAIFYGAIGIEQRRYR